MIRNLFKVPSPGSLIELKSLWPYWQFDLKNAGAGKFLCQRRQGLLQAPAGWSFMKAGGRVHLGGAMHGTPQGRRSLQPKPTSGTLLPVLQEAPV